MTCDLSDRDFALETFNELEQMIKQLNLTKSVAPSGEVEYLMHRPIQVIKLGRILSVIAGDEQAALEAMLNIRNLFAHFNGLSFSSDCVDRHMGAIVSLVKPEKDDGNRQVFDAAFRKLFKTFLVRMGDV